MITVLGSINIDLTFRLAHLPAPGETILTPGFSQAVGGKGANQAVAAARDGARVAFTGCVGDDAFGVAARAGLVESGVDTAGLATVSGPTGLAAVWIDPQGRNQIAVASGANGLVRAAALDDARPASAGLLVLQMEIPSAEVVAAIGRAKARGMRVLLNLAPALPLPLAALRQVDVLVVNEHEAATLCGQLGLAGVEPQVQARALATHLGTTIIITLGAAGALAVRETREWSVPALAVAAIDTTGAGDCFVGVLAAGLARGSALPGALRRAAVAGSLACTIVGAVPSFPTGAAIDAASALALPQVR